MPMKKHSQNKIVTHSSKPLTIVTTQQTAQMGNPFNDLSDPYNNANKIELHGHFFNMFTENSVLVIWKTDMVSFLQGQQSS